MSTEDRAVDTLLACAAEWSGYQPEGVAREAVRRALRRELATGASLTDIVKRAQASDPELMRTLRSAVGVRETFFFRNPEQFELVAVLAQELATRGFIRAWSAGCATGEETWSLAATLKASVPNSGSDVGTRIAVLGSDIYEPGLEIARAGTYGPSSIRPSGPLLYPVIARSSQRAQVLDSLRSITSFVAHDLRDEAPGQFEVVFCRNVLIYFSRTVARQIVDRLCAALAPGGVILFGTMDVDPADVPGLARVGQPELMAFTKKVPVRRRKPTTRKVVPPPKPAVPDVPAEAIALHRSALVWIELGNRSSAERVLADLNRRYPDYLPGILERALVHVRKGEREPATMWMQQVLERAERLGDADPVSGIETLPASFYRYAARAYLDRAEEDR